MPASPKRPGEVFLSHSHRDRRFVDELIAVLHRHGIRYWYSPRHIVAARQWHDEIGRALKRCDWFVVVLSPHAVRSVWVQHELRYALNARRFRHRIVPALHKTCKFERLSWTLQGFQMANFTRGFAAGCRELLRSWGMKYTAAKKVRKKQVRKKRKRRSSPRKR